MPDDLTAHQLEILRKLTGKLDRLLDRSAQEAEAAQQARRQLDALGKKVTSCIDEDRAVTKAQLALTDARAEHARQFGHYQAVRRRATGMLRAMATKTVGSAALLRAAGQLMVDASDYWLSPAQVALAAEASSLPSRDARPGGGDPALARPPPATYRRRSGYRQAGLGEDALSPRRSPARRLPQRAGNWPARCGSVAVLGGTLWQRGG